jgi:hypothetical protein
MAIMFFIPEKQFFHHNNPLSSQNRSRLSEIFQNSLLPALLCGHYQGLTLDCQQGVFISLLSREPEYFRKPINI